MYPQKEHKIKLKTLKNKIHFTQCTTKRSKWIKVKSQLFCLSSLTPLTILLCGNNMKKLSCYFKKPKGY